MENMMKITASVMTLASLMFAGTLRANMGNSADFIQPVYDHAHITGDSPTIGFEHQGIKPIQIAGKPKEKTKVKVKTKKDGTIIVKEKHKANDGEGNKTSSTTTTTVPPSDLSR